MSNIHSGFVLPTGNAIQTALVAGNTALFQAYDVDGAAYVTFLTLTANNTPTCDLNTAVTIGTAYIYRTGGTDVPVTDGGTGVSTLALNGVLYGNGASAVGVTAIGAEGQILRVGATPFVPAWTTATYPATTTINQLLYSSAANVIAGLATGNSGVLVTGATGIPSISTDIPTAVTIGTAYIYRVGGTDVSVADGGTGASTLTDGGLLVGAGTGVIEALAVGLTTQILVGGGAGTNPAWGADLPTAVTIGSAYIYRVSGTDVAVADGGTGLSTFAAGSVVVANALDTISAVTSTVGLTALKNDTGVISWNTTTGTGSSVMATSPALTTPNIGVATATSVNKITLTQPANGSTLTILDGKTLTVNNTLILAGTDSTTMTFPATSQTIAGLGVNQTFSAGQIITIANTVNQVGLTINQNDTTNNPNAFTIVNAGTGTGIYIDGNGNGISLNIDSEATTAVGGAISLTSQGTTLPLNFVNEGVLVSNSAFFRITSTAVQANGNTAIFNIYSNQANSNGNLMRLWNDNASSAGQSCLEIVNDGTAVAIKIDQNANSNALYIDKDCTVNDTRTWAMQIDSDNAGTGTALGCGIDMSSFAVDEPIIKAVADAGNTAGTLTGQIAIDIAGTTYYVYYYTTSTVV